MRTTLNLDDDIAIQAKHIATLQKKSLGKVISALARKGLYPYEDDPPEYRNGIRLFKLTKEARPYTIDELNAIRDEEL